MSGEINKRLSKLQSTLSPAALTQVAYPIFRALTPIKSGNAKSKTNIVKNEIEAAYPYASRLDEGYSKQAPRGMTAPTIERVQQYIKGQANGN